MVSTAPGGGPFLLEAARIGRSLARGAIRHGGRATWLADDYVRSDTGWRRATSTLGPDFGTGTAGVGFFLAHDALVTEDARVAVVAVEALRHALAHGEAMVAGGRFGWYDGALGVAGAAMLSSDRLGHVELAERATRLAERVIRAIERVQPSSPDLMGGAAGVLVGLLTLSLASPELSASADAAAAALARSLATQSATEFAARPLPAGLLRGRSGVGLALAAWAARADGDTASVASKVLQAERRHLSPGLGWWCEDAHAWTPWDPASRTGSHRAWCAGAAGIGIARLVAFALTREPHLLAEAAAALDLIREAPMGGDRDGADDASTCHGWSGEIELLLAAATILDEPAHLATARAVTATRVARASTRRAYSSGLWPGAHAPALMHGVAGVGLTLLRVHDPSAAPSFALPPCVDFAALHRRAIRA